CSAAQQRSRSRRRGRASSRRCAMSTTSRLRPTTMLRDTQAFFAERAATWDERFSGDDAAFAQAITELNAPAGGGGVGLGCGTGRALPHFISARTALGLDVTQEMLTVAHDKQ